jgi:hypothetical protein
MTELVPRPVLCVEVFHNHIGATILGGLATSVEYLQLHNRLPWKPWSPLLERTHDGCFLRRLRRLAHKCTGPPLLNDGTSFPPDHSNSHPLFLCKPGPPWPIERTKHWTLCPVLPGLSRGRFRTDGWTDDRTMAAGASMTWTHYSILFEVT